MGSQARCLRCSRRSLRHPRVPQGSQLLLPMLLKGCLRQRLRYRSRNPLPEHQGNRNSIYHPCTRSQSQILRREHVIVRHTEPGRTVSPSTCGCAHAANRQAAAIKVKFLISDILLFQQSLQHLFIDRAGQA